MSSTEFILSEVEVLRLTAARHHTERSFCKTPQKKFLLQLNFLSFHSIPIENLIIIDPKHTKKNSFILGSRK